MRLLVLVSKSSTVLLCRITVTVADTGCSADWEQKGSVTTSIQKFKDHVWCLWSLLSQLNFLPLMSWSYESISYFKRFSELILYSGNQIRTTLCYFFVMEQSRKKNNNCSKTIEKWKKENKSSKFINLSFLSFWLV